MKYTEVKYSKTVEGTYAVQLIFNHNVISTIVFPSDELANEYTLFKHNKLEAGKKDEDSVEKISKPKASKHNVPEEEMESPTITTHEPEAETEIKQAVTEEVSSESHKSDTPVHQGKKGKNKAE